MKALEAFIMLKVVDEVVDKVEKKVAVAQRTAPRVAETSGGGATIKTRVLARVPQAIDTEDAIEG